MFAHRRSLVFGLLLVGVFLISCSQRVALYAAPTNLPSGVYIKVNQAYVRGDRLYVETWMMNATQGPIGIDRDGLSLRLPSGRVLPRSIGTFTHHSPYQLAPGTGRDVNVDFRSDDLDGINGATLIVGGVSFGTDPMPRVAGELALSTSYVPQSGGPPPPLPAVSPSASPPPAAPSGSAAVAP